MEYPLIYGQRSHGAILREVLGDCQGAWETVKYPGQIGEWMATLSIGRTKAIGALAISLFAFAPPGARADSDLHDLYAALQSKGHAVTIPASLLERLKLGAPPSDIRGKEIVVAGEWDKRGITTFELAGVPYIAMYHTEADKDDSWLIRFDLDGHILNQEWEESGYRTYVIRSPAVAGGEIGFWRERLGK